MNNQKQIRTAKFLSITVVTVMFLLAVVLVFQFVKIYHLKSEENQLNKYLQQLENDIIHYSSENAYLKSDKYIEDYAREVLGYGLNGETRFK